MSKEVRTRRPARRAPASATAPHETAPAPAEASPAASDAAPAPTTAPAPDTIDEHLLGSIEAVLLSVDRPVSAPRLAEALGLLDEDAADAAEARDDAASPDAAEPEIVVRARGKSAAPPSPIAIVRRAVAALNEQYQASGRAFRIEPVAGGYRVMTLPAFAGVIAAFRGKRERTTLSRPAVETLAIIAYKQPITRAQLEAIRGVATGEVLRTLMERRLVTITGRAEELGRPMLYGTTKQFLEAFGLASLKDLPSAAEFKARHAGGESSDE